MTHINPFIPKDAEQNGNGDAVLLRETANPDPWNTVPPATLPTGAVVSPGRDWGEAANRVLDAAGSGWHQAKKFLKLGLCLTMDFFDFFIGRLLGFGIAFDIGCALIATALWGKRGWWALLEVADITEQLDGFVPTCTIIALKSWNDD